MKISTAAIAGGCRPAASRPRMTVASLATLSSRELRASRSPPFWSGNHQSQSSVALGGSAPSIAAPPALRIQSRLHQSSTTDDDDESDALCSPRATRAVELLPTYLADARAVERYSPETPHGALQLSVAENQMLEDMLVPSLTEFSKSQEFPADAIYYQPTHGRPSFRKAMAKFLEDILQLPQPMDEDGIVVGAGCNAVLENLCLTLASPGEGVMIPTPYYAAFEFDLVARAGLSIIPVTTMQHSGVSMDAATIPNEAYYPNKSSLDAAYDAACLNGTKPRILLLSHPMNPLGICYPPEVIQSCVDWCRTNRVHLISDEIYAGSVFSPDSNFQSTLKIAAGAYPSKDGLGLGPYIHLVYALSKDFALSGLRVGALYSENPSIRQPLQKLNDLCCISSHTQLLVEKMLTTLADDPKVSWYRRFLNHNQERLRQRSKVWQDCLDELAIPHLAATAGLFVWMDLREFLPDVGSDEERERELYLTLLKTHGLLFTPGGSMKNELPGFFRCVFTAASDEEFQLALERIRKFVHESRNRG